MAKKKAAKNLLTDLLTGASLEWDLASESDIGCALIGGEHLNYELEKLISEKITDKSIFSKQIDGNSMLSNFSSKIYFAYLTGLISKSIFHDLNLIKNIRNRFAHTECKITFNDEEIRNLCNKFENFHFNDHSASRKKFCSVVSYIKATINMSHMISKKFEISTYWKTAQEDARKLGNKEKK